MTAESELFVTEFVRDEVEKILKERLGKDGIIYVEVECPPDWYDLWSEAQFPNGGKANLLDEDENVVGEVEWETVFSIEEDIGGKYIAAEPKITKLVYRGVVYV